MRVSLCIGNYATIPYRIPGLGMNVYCIEEMCYCFKESAYLLDRSLMNDDCVDWISRECGLVDLARELYPLVHKKGSLSSFVTLIMEYTGFYGSDTIYQISQILKQGAGLTAIEKKKTQTDYLLSRKKYVAAINGYDILLNQWAELEQMQKILPAPEVKAAILHNKGVALAFLMLYDKAEICFQAAYEISGDDEEYLTYLASKRMTMDDSQYIAFAAEDMEHYELTLELEKRMQQVKDGYESSSENDRVKRRQFWRQGSEKQTYYDDNDIIIQRLKNDYISCVSD